ncbi:MAG: DUF6174 domain-containing protein [Gemmatimonadota bacterium]
MNPLSNALLAALLLTACSTGPSDDLEGARQRWSSQHIDTYVITVRRSCFCGGPSETEIHVENGTIRSIVDPATGAQLPVPLSPPYLDVEGLFATVATAIQQPAASLTVTYNRDHGYPEQVSIDWIKNAADDEVAYAVTHFRTGT